MFSFGIAVFCKNGGEGLSNSLSDGYVCFRRAASSPSGGCVAFEDHSLDGEETAWAR
jgi:hypothetical protein